MRARHATAALSSILVLALVSACSFVGGDDEPDPTTDGTAEGGGTVVLLTHGDFALPKRVERRFEDESGYDLEIRPSGGVGEVVNLVSDEAGNPSGDVVFGVDNTFGSRVLDAGALAPYDGELPPGVAADALPGDDEGQLVPVDNGSVCVNVDDVWFDEQGLEPPQDLEDLADPAYRGLFVTPSASGSSPGLAFLLTTVAAYGDDWPAYWQRLLDNDTEVVQDWSQAYYEEFTQGGEGGGSGARRPIVLSYDSSPAFTLAEDGGSSRTHALLDTCYGQVEYAGVLEGATNPDGARALVDFMLTAPVQEALPTSMYVFPTVDGTPLPPEWERFAPRPTDPFEVDPADVEAHREDWLLEWTDLLSQ